MEQNDAEELVARAARKIEQLLRKRSAALEVRLIPLRGASSRETKSSVCFLRTFEIRICLCSMGVYRMRDVCESFSNPPDETWEDEEEHKGEFFINSAQTCTTRS